MVKRNLICRERTRLDIQKNMRVLRNRLTEA
nr:MAG TPA: hypothetical protein [Caudoviricetes sp.]